MRREDMSRYLLLVRLPSCSFPPLVSREAMHVSESSDYDTYLNRAIAMWILFPKEISLSLNLSRAKHLPLIRNLYF